MPEVANAKLFDNFYEGFESVWAILEGQSGRSFGNLTVQARKLISETAIFLHEIMEEEVLESAEKEFANSWIRRIGHILGREFEGNFILRFYYFAKNYSRNPIKTVDEMISVVVALRALEICGPKLVRNGTVWGYLERDMRGFRNVLIGILNENNVEEKINELFLLLNTIDMLSTITDSEELEREFNEFIKLTHEKHESFERSFKISPGLKVYAADLVNRIGLPIKIDDLPEMLSGKPGAFLILMQLRMGQIPSIDKIKNVYHPSTLHLWWIAEAWRRLRVGETFIGILPFYRRLDVDAIFRIVWGDSKELYGISVTDAEILSVLELTGKEIKQHLYNYFIKHSNLTDFSRTRLAAERDKADAGGEISDFNIEFTTGREKIWVAIPIKSGRESGGQNRPRLEQNYLYQFIRPLVTFETGEIVVFPIILVKPTLNTNEFLSLIKARLQLPILVLDIDAFSRILKREKALCA